MSRPLPQLSELELARFKTKLLPAQNGCIEWSGYRMENGYGSWTVSKKTFLAHRLAYFIHFGNDPVGKVIAHRCDNPACCNPDHLFLTDTQGNTDDKIAKARDAHGEKQGLSKLTDGEVVEIRNLYEGGKTLLELADKFHVTFKNINSVVLGKSWKHLPVLSSGDNRFRRSRGEKHYHSRFTTQDVINIRSRHSNGVPVRKLARELGCGRNTITHIVKRESWKHC